ncbi:MAG: hypothetical protein H8E14_10615 [Candidatus Marinimicrobia bacterium]|nr:hypothetical protein [Candidatus Neomarinimicrobiota bacterium]
MNSRLLFVAAATLLLTIATTLAQPEPVVPITRNQHPHSWYAEQSRLWQEVVSKEPTNAPAWFNYFLATRYVRITSWNHSEYNQANYQDLGNIVAQMEKHIPNSFEFHYASFYYVDDIAQHNRHLFRAHQIAPDRVDIYPHLLVTHELNQDQKRATVIAKKYDQSGHASPSLLDWNYNMLAPLAEDAILFVNGDNDSYPKWILQYARGMRPDVVVIEVGMLYIDDFRTKVLKRIGLPSFPGEETYPDFTDFIRAFFRHAIQHSKRPLYFATTLYQKYTSKISNDLYNEGLALRYRAQSYDNLKVQADNFEKYFRLDYLQVDDIDDVSKGIVNRLDLNYLYSFADLYKYYLTNGNLTQATKVKNLLNAIAGRGGNPEAVNFVEECLAEQQ